MKVLTILLNLIGIFMILAYGLMYLMGFAMSFDAPGSDTDPKAWLMRLVMFLPVILGIVVVVLSFMALRSGQLNRSAILASVIPVIGVLFWGYMFFESARTFKSIKAEQAEAALEAELYPKQTYMRPSSHGGSDTIIVWPSRIVAYRLDMGEGNRVYGGPLGDLNPNRDTLIYLERQDTRLRRDELDQFVDAGGRRFTEAYGVR